MLKTENTLVATLSDAYGLDLVPGSAGFTVKDALTGEEYAVVDAVNTVGPRENNYAKSVLITLGSNVNVNSTIEIAHPRFEAPVKVDFSEFAWKEAEKTIPAADVKLGCTYDAATNKASFPIKVNKPKMLRGSIIS